MKAALKSGRIAYRDVGSGPAVVWIHGYPLSSRVFEPQLEIDGVRHLVPDLPGFGESDPPAGPMSMDSYASTVLQLMDEADLQRAVIAGLSMGGYIAMALARLAPKRVRGLILIDTRETADAPEARKKRLETAAGVESAGEYEGVVKEMLPKMLTEKTRQNEPTATLRVRSIMESASPAGVSAALRAMADRPDSADTLRALNVPALIVVGERDEITPPSDAQRMHGMLVNSRLTVIPGAAHLSNVERPREFNNAVKAFLTTVPA